MTHWHLVKRNWPRTHTCFCRYGGLGGDAWPLDDQAVEWDIHDRLMRERSYAAIGDSEEFVCQDSTVALEYFNVAVRELDDGRPVWLLRVGSGSAPEHWDGFDIGLPSGGGSIIESELIGKLQTDALNAHGLFPSAGLAREYLASRSDPNLEDADSLSILGLSVLRCSWDDRRMLEELRSQRRATTSG